MSATESIMHRHFEALVEEYHSFAEYEGYAECDDFDGFLVAYRGVGERKYMLVDSDLNVVNDQTFGTGRWGGVILGGLLGIGMLLGGGTPNQNE